MARRPTIIDVARLAKVSKTTVARVINGEEKLVREETRRRVLSAVDQLGYEANAIARSLRTERTFTLALSIPDITNPFWPEVARGVQDTIEERGYTVVLLNSDWLTARQSSHLRAVRRNLFDGLIVNPVGISGAELQELRIPVILLGGHDDYPLFDAVGSDSEMAVRLALEHLFELGHRRIGLITGTSEWRSRSTRLASYNAFHEKRDLPIDDSLIVRCGFSREAGAAALRRLLQLDRPPTAICAGNDLLAIGALTAARESGIEVPQEISIIGIDDIYAAATTYPRLTTVSKPKYEIGVAAARLLLERVDESAVGGPRQLKLPCRLMVRDSTAPLGATLPGPRAQRV